jgi:hypothetical protein
MRTRNPDCGTEWAWDNGFFYVSWSNASAGAVVPSPGSTAEQSEGAAISCAVRFECETRRD